MKKGLLFLTLLAGGTASAQIKYVKPQDGLLYPKFDFQKDTTWRSLAKLNNTPLPNGYLALANRTDLKKISADNGPLIVAVDGYKMPVLVSEDCSNMPIKKINGFSKMPVVGTNMGAPKKITKVTP